MGLEIRLISIDCIDETSGWGSDELLALFRVTGPNGESTVDDVRSHNVDTGDSLAFGESGRILATIEGDSVTVGLASAGLEIDGTDSNFDTQRAAWDADALEGGGRKDPLWNHVWEVEESFVRERMTDEEMPPDLPRVASEFNTGGVFAEDELQMFRLFLPQSTELHEQFFFWNRGEGSEYHVTFAYRPI